MLVALGLWYGLTAILAVVSYFRRCEYRSRAVWVFFLSLVLGLYWPLRAATYPSSAFDGIDGMTVAAELLLLLMLLGPIHLYLAVWMIDRLVWPPRDAAPLDRT